MRVLYYSKMCRAVCFSLEQQQELGMCAPVLCNPQSGILRLRLCSPDVVDEAWQYSEAH